jgi:hypothetical protein
VRIPCYSLYQTWASAMTLLLKRVETRPRVSHYRGLLGIHAAATWNRELKEIYSGKRSDAVREHFHSAPPLGAIVGLCVQTGYARTEDVRGKIAPLEASWGDYGDGRFAWLTDGMIPLKNPLPFKGNRGTFYWEPESVRDLLEKPFDGIHTAVDRSAYVVCLHCGKGFFTMQPRVSECIVCEAHFDLVHRTP